MLRKHEIAWRFLYALRRGNNAPKDLAQIVELVFGGDAAAERQGWGTMHEVAVGLVQAGLVEHADQSFKLTAHYEQIRHLLQFSSLEFASRTEASLVCTPVFGRPGPERFDVFVALPFRPEYFEVLDRAIKPACERSGLTVGYGDDLCAPKSIIHEVWSLIHNARVVIGECSSLNPNVLYEIGIAHTLGRHVIVLSRNVQELPFDLQHLKTIAYSPDADGLAVLEQQLSKWLVAVKPTA